MQIERVKVQYKGFLTFPLSFLFELLDLISKLYFKCGYIYLYVFSFIIFVNLNFYNFFPLVLFIFLFFAFGLLFRIVFVSFSVSIRFFLGSFPYYPKNFPLSLRMDSLLKLAFYHFLELTF